MLIEQFKKLTMGATTQYASTGGQKVNDIIANTKKWENLYKNNQLRANLMALTTALIAVSADLKKIGYTLVVGFVNDDHGAHQGSTTLKSHLYNTKADVYLINNSTNSRVAATEWASNENLRTNVLNIFNSHGLHAQAEHNEGVTNKFWLDTWIWQGYTKNGAELIGYGNKSWGTHNLYTVHKKG